MSVFVSCARLLFVIFLFLTITCTSGDLIASGENSEFEIEVDLEGVQKCSIHPPLHTKDDYDYSKNYISNVSKKTSFRFDVQACRDAHIALGMDGNGNSPKMYEILLGGWANTVLFRKFVYCIDRKVQFVLINA